MLPVRISFIRELGYRNSRIWRILEVATNSRGEYRSCGKREDHGDHDFIIMQERSFLPIFSLQC
jgi:hypothetical protein